MPPVAAGAAAVVAVAPVVGVAPPTVVAEAGGVVPPAVVPDVAGVVVVLSLPHAAINAAIVGMARTPVASCRRVIRPLSCEAIKPSTVALST